MLLIQVVAGVLLLLGSGLIFQALLAMDAPSTSRDGMRRRLRVVEPDAEVRTRDLPRAA